MPEGFQTQLSETFNKQKEADAPLLEAFMDAHGRLAFRFVGEGGVPIAQPRVTTPGFAATPPSLEATPPSISTTKRLTPQASIIAPGLAGGGQAGGVATGLAREGGFGTTADDASDVPSLQTAPASRTALGVIGAVPGFGLATGLTAVAQAIGLRGVTGGPVKPSFTTPQEKAVFDRVVALGRKGQEGFPTASTQQGILDVKSQVDTFSSMSDLDNMSGLGSPGGAFGKAGLGGFGETGRGGSSAGAGPGNSPTGSDVEGTPF